MDCKDNFDGKTMDDVEEESEEIVSCDLLRNAGGNNNDVNKAADSPCPVPVKKINQSDKIRVVISTDCGVDDGMAMFNLVAEHQRNSEDFKIEGIISSFGNSSLANTTQNLHQVLKVMGETEIPIYRGAETALLSNFQEKTDFFGSDGFNDSNLEKIVERTDPMHGAVALINLVKSNKNQISWLELAPLTTLATAIQLYPSLCSELKELVILGGTTTCHGTVTATSDFNFMMDPDAAKMVFEKLKCPIILLPKEVRQKYGRVPRDFRITNMGSLATDQIKLLNLLEEKKFLAMSGLEFWKSNDAIAACICINRKIIENTEDYYVQVSNCNCVCRGATVIDRANYYEKPTNCTIITKFNNDLMMKMFLFGVGGPYYKE